MKSEKGLIHLLIAGEAFLLVLVVLLCIFKQTKEPAEKHEIVVNTRDNVIAEMPSETESEGTETEAGQQVTEPEIVFSEEIVARLAEMSLEEKVAQLFVVSPEALTNNEQVTIAGNGTRDALLAYPVGGILYSYANYMGNIQMENLIRGAQEMSFEQNGQYLFAALQMQTAEGQPVIAAAGNGQEQILTELVRTSNETAIGETTGVVLLEGLLLMTYVENESALAEAESQEGLICAAVEANQMNPVNALQNGADLLCVTVDFGQAYEAVLNAVETGEITEAKIDRAVGRILVQKDALNGQITEE